MKKGRIIIVSGPSGVGKGTVLKAVMRDRTDLKFSVSATTRPIRPGEVDGFHYFFIDKPAFEKMIEDGALLEHASYAENYYGTPEKPVNAALDQGVSVILEIDVQGALQVMQRRPDAISIFIAPPSFEELSRRLSGRGDTEPEIVAKRLKIAIQECEAAEHYQYIVINDTVEAAAAKVEAILLAEDCRSRYCSIVIKEENENALSCNV